MGLVQQSSWSQVGPYASAARTTAQTGADQSSPGGRFLHVIMDITAASGTGGLTLTIQAKDPTSGKYYNLLVGTAQAATGTNVYRIGPGLTAAGNLVANDIVPGTFRINIAVGDASSYTYSVGYWVGG